MICNREINSQSEKIKCFYCHIEKIKSGYEVLDDNCNWFCSINCERNYELVRYY